MKKLIGLLLALMLLFSLAACSSGSVEEEEEVTAVEEIQAEEEAIEAEEEEEMEEAEIEEEAEDEELSDEEAELLALLEQLMEEAEAAEATMVDIPDEALTYLTDQADALFFLEEGDRDGIILSSGYLLTDVVAAEDEAGEVLYCLPAYVLLIQDLGDGSITLMPRIYFIICDAQGQVPESCDFQVTNLTVDFSAMTVYSGGDNTDWYIYANLTMDELAGCMESEYISFTQTIAVDDSYYDQDMNNIEIDVAFTLDIFYAGEYLQTSIVPMSVGYMPE